MHKFVYLFSFWLYFEQKLFELYGNITTFVSDYNTTMMSRISFLTLLILTVSAASKAFGQERTETLSAGVIRRSITAYLQYHPSRTAL